MAEKKTNNNDVFNTLFNVNVNDHTEKKNGLTYLAWAFAWAEVKKRYPQATYKIYEAENGWNYFTDGRTCWVKTSVTIDGIENIEYLPIMDFRNQSIGIDRVTSMDVNKAIQRSLTKCCARHGLGLYIYAGEDLPEDQSAKPVAQKGEPAPKQAPASLFKVQELQDAFEMVRANIESAPSNEYLMDLYKHNPALHDFKPFMDALRKRKKEITA